MFCLVENQTDLGLDTEQERREFEGTVTHVYDSHGLVDNEVYFCFDQIIGGDKPCVNDQVIVRAVRHHANGGWHAELVTIVTTWEDSEDDPDEVLRPPELVGVVTHSNGDTGYVNNDIYFDLKECAHDDFVPYKGDWVKISISYSGDDRIERKVTKIEPVRIKETEGVISAARTDHGYIDGEVFYIADALHIGFSPQKWDAVHYR